MEQERLFRYRSIAWRDVMKEVVIDRGTLLGSNEFDQMSGVERTTNLKQIDDSLSECYRSIEQLRENRDRSIPVKRGFHYRCRRIRGKVADMTDDDLGTKEDSA